MPDVTLSPSGPPDTRLPPLPDGVADALSSEDAEVVAAVVTRYPTLPAVWAQAGALAERDAQSGSETVVAYALYRVGYHRGLDMLRKHGWRGSGYVRWSHVPNRGFLECLAGLARLAAAIEESDEAIRCEEFLRMLDPEWPPAS